MERFSKDALSSSPATSDLGALYFRHSLFLIVYSFFYPSSSGENPKWRIKSKHILNHSIHYITTGIFLSSLHGIVWPSFVSAPKTDSCQNCNFHSRPAMTTLCSVTESATASFSLQIGSSKIYLIYDCTLAFSAGLRLDALRIPFM